MASKSASLPALPKHTKRTSQFTMVTLDDIGRCSQRMLGPWLYIRLRTQMGGSRLITCDEIHQGIGGSKNSIIRGVDDLIKLGLVRVLPAPARLRRLYAIDPEKLEDREPESEAEIETGAELDPDTLMDTLMDDAAQEGAP